MQIFGPNELLEDVHKRDLCIGCGACVNLCPYFKNYRGKTAMLFPCTLSEGRCYTSCPKAELDMDELSSLFFKKPYDGSPLGNYRDVFVAHAGKGMTDGTFQAGGTVSALMAFALKTGMIDAAVLTDHKDMIPVPRLVTNPEEVTKCATSKYMAAPTLAGLNQGVQEGYRHLGVVGTPCQVMAVAKMRSNLLKKETFVDTVALVVGLFCTWALDTRELLAFLSKKVDISRIRKTDIPPPPAEVFIVDTGDEIIEIPLEEIRPLVPNACHVCPDMTSEWADISVGVLEGAPDRNTLIVRTEKGERLVQEATEAGYLILDKMPDENLEHLSLAAANKKRRSLNRAREEGLLNSPADGPRAVLRIAEEVVQSIIG